MIRLIATDIDGTLIEDSTGDLYPEMVEEIRRLTKQGVLFCAASGRQYESIRHVFREVADRIIYVAENGAQIRYRKEDISVVEMPRKEAEELIRELRQYQDSCDFVVSTPEGSLVESENEEFLQLLEQGYRNKFRRVADVLAGEERILKVALYRKGSIRSLGESVLIPRWKDRLKTCMAGEEWVDFMDPSVDKGNALKDLQAYFQINQSETMAFGDNANDIGMLRTAGVSYAVETARDEVKEAADHLCPGWREKGVWQILRHVRNGKTLEKDVLYIQMLGNFSMKFNGKDITPEYDTASKPMQLLQMILEAGEEGIKRETILKNLYDNCDQASAANSLKQLVFRLRKVLGQIGLPEDEYIVNKGSRYVWSGRIPMLLDTRVIQQRAQLVEEAKGEARRKEYRKELCLTYRGPFLPRLTEESWAADIRKKYETVYFEYLQQCCDTVSTPKEQEEVLELCRRAAEMYPYEKWGLQMIDSLIALGRYSEAKQLYFKAIRFYEEKLKTPPSEELRRRFRMMSMRVKDHAGQLEEIRKSLHTQNEMSTVLRLDIMSMPEVYKALRKTLGRLGLPLTVVLCTLQDENGNMLLDQKKLQQAAEKVERAIRASLRDGDCYNRYSESQFFLILPGLTQREGIRLMEKVERCLEKEYQLRKGLLHYDAAEDFPGWEA